MINAPERKSDAHEREVQARKKKTQNSKIIEGKDMKSGK